MSQPTYLFLVIAQSTVGLGVFLALLFVSAPYGKHSRPGWGPKLNSRMGWILMETPAVLAPLGFFFIAGSPSAGMIFAICLWELHYVYRCCIYPALQRGSRASFPLVLTASALLFNINNGVIIGFDLFVRGRASSINLADLRCVLGLALFVAGFALHVTSDAIIRSLRRDGEENYHIPQGGLFRLVSNPNYLGEIVQWIGFALLTGSLAAWAFALFTFCNVFPRAIANHRWYRDHFVDYPQERKIILPYIF